MKYFDTVPRARLQRWNVRQRKKLRVGEFQELGFTLFLRFAPPLDENTFEPFLDAAIGEIEALGLCVGGLGGAIPIDDTEGFITAFGRGSVTPAQQARLLDWCRKRPEVAEARTGALIDIWHGWREE